MHTDEGGDTSFRDPVTGLIGIDLITILVLIRDGECPGEMLPKVVHGPDLECLPVGHDCIDSDGIIRARELVPVRAF